MGAKKKKGGKGKKGKGGGGDESGGALTPADEAKLFQNTIVSLEKQLAERTEDTCQAIAERRDLQRRVEEMKDIYDDEQTAKQDISRQMTRQYKQMQEQYIAQINHLNNTIQECKDQLETERVEREEMEKLHMAEVDRKDTEIDKLKAKMEDMAAEFSEMLQETLRKMQERIELSAGPYNTEDAVQVQRRMQPLDDFKI
mmetsp:Transcript_34751/g.109112  ORF Transcript_34751/g.109112 Transcript_34751/m.109112 type:complete len:199 (-) Transcript_34751:214-810(-)